MLVSFAKKIGTVLIAGLFPLFALAQKELVIGGKPGDWYVRYLTESNESLQQVSNRFGLSVSKLQSYNHTNINTNAAFPNGTEVRIPVTRDNLLQEKVNGAEAVVHRVKNGDNLFRVSQQYYKVPIAKLRNWNSLKKDIVKNGQLLIIGYMVNAAEQANSNHDKPAIMQESPVADKPVAEKTAVAHPPVAPLPGKLATFSEAGKLAHETEPADEGYFAQDYMSASAHSQPRFKAGDAAIFKTISGWSDKKYYVLTNAVPPKTIVRITAPNHRSICAMVLGALPDTKGDKGLLLRISNSAASVLGLSDEVFTVSMAYYE
ncbi:MAG TPA: LysM peptidoglycan-binding domain-containing protein [Sediminibacterium sp.]|nr:LysM peptidoglycan-binding domain-containing protein [Sediminibacterium sp.]